MEETCTVPTKKEKDKDDEIEAKPIKEKNFRIQNQRLHLTYKSHIKKDEYKKWAKEELRVKECHMSHEEADKHHPYFHTHVILEWPSVFQTKNCRRFDYGDIHPNIKPITSRRQLEHTYRYLAKEDPESAYLLELESKGFSKRVWSCKTLQEALEECTKPADVIGTKAMFEAKPVEPVRPDTITEFRPWQEKLLAELKKEPDDRHIFWIYDKVGGCGKSRLARHMEDTNMGINISGTTSQRDIALVIKNEKQAGSPLRVITLDLTRSFKDRDIYNTIEMLKNGRMISPKYESCRLRWNPGHIVVFANFLPDPHGCSWDRWWIREIHDADYSLLPE